MKKIKGNYLTFLVLAVLCLSITANTVVAHPDHDVTCAVGEEFTVEVPVLLGMTIPELKDYDHDMVQFVKQEDGYLYIKYVFRALKPGHITIQLESTAYPWFITTTITREILITEK